jgi:hypothetical protein
MMIGASQILPLHRLIILDWKIEISGYRRGCFGQKIELIVGNTTG